MSEQRVVIIGAGPAGMVLAYQLASSGVSVRVLERHPDFEREFRGELVQGSVVAQLEKAGIFGMLVARGLALPNVERQMFVGHRRRVEVPGPREAGAIISQPGFLSVMHELCSAFPGYRLDFSTAVTGAVQHEGRVVAVTTRTSGGDTSVGGEARTESRVEGNLFIVCNGRNSPLRKSFGLETETFATTADALWLRFDLSDNPAALPANVEVHMFGKGVVMVTQPSSNHRLHIAFSAPGDLATLRKDLPKLRERLLPTLNEPLRSLVAAQLSERTETQVLKVIVDRVKSWHAPGILFLGDAAHTMSPSGGQGLNVAIRDTFVAANHLVPALTGQMPIDAALLAAIQSERQPEVDAIQAGQTRAGTMVLKPLLVLHFMFTLLGAAMLLLGAKMRRGHGLAPPEPKFMASLRP